LFFFSPVLGFRASSVIRDHPSIQQMLQFINHERILPHLEKMLAHFKSLAVNHQLAQCREQVTGLISQIHLLAPILPLFASSLYANAVAHSASGAQWFGQQAQGCYSNIFSCFQPPVPSQAASSDLSSSPVNKIPTDQSKSMPTGGVHTGITCDGCTVFPIVGERWKCSICHDFDLCASCHNLGVHPKSHPMNQIEQNQGQRHPRRDHHFRAGGSHPLRGAVQQAWRAFHQAAAPAPPASSQNFDAQLAQLAEFGFDQFSPASRALLVQLLVENNGDVQNVLNCLL